jgi:tRNA U34 5-carboxymethylaminomethyl modifying enzyme MnmG/GidA
LVSADYYRLFDRADSRNQRVTRAGYDFTLMEMKRPAKYLGSDHP